AIDYAGNSVTTLPSTFTYVTARPTVTITMPVFNNNFYSQVQVSTPFAGQAASDSTPGNYISTVAVALNDITGGVTTYFNGTTFAGGGPYFKGAQGSTSSWTYNNANISLTNDHYYLLIASATDFGGNISSTSVFFYYDVNLPTTTITYPYNGVNLS